MINLDDKTAVLKIQGGDAVLNSVNNLDKQLRHSFNDAQKITFPQEYANAKNIVVSGMGGSRFPALIVRELFKNKLKIPYLINDDYTLPKFVNKNTLFILSSYSGTTEEVIENGKVAHKAGAKLAGICAGGEIASFLKEIGAPVYVFNPIYNSSGQPRIGFGYGVGGHLGILVKIGFLKKEEEQISQAIDNLSQLLRAFMIEMPKKSNPSKQLAEKLYQKYPYYIVSEFLNGVGNAVANQTNETAKGISSFRIIPELNHHLMEGLKFPDALHNLAVFVFFFSKLYHPRIQKRFYITKEIVGKNNIDSVWHELKGRNKIEQVFELMGLSSYLSMYLSALYEQDPTSIPFVDYFKNKMKD